MEYKRPSPEIKRRANTHQSHRVASTASDLLNFKSGVFFHQSPIFILERDKNGFGERISKVTIISLTPVKYLIIF